MAVAVGGVTAGKLGYQERFYKSLIQVETLSFKERDKNYLRQRESKSISYFLWREASHS